MLEMPAGDRHHAHPIPEAIAYMELDLKMTIQHLSAYCRQEVKSMRKIKHWQDAVNAVIGFALILSPLALKYVDESVATTNAVVIGLALVATALGAMLTPKAWEEWTEAILGLWMVLSPWLLGFSTHMLAMYMAVASGVLVVLFALWTLATDKDFALPKSMQP